MIIDEGVFSPRKNWLEHALTMLDATPGESV